MIVRTEAIVLRSMKYSESSLIVTLLTREKGKLTVIAKGARRTKSRFGGALQPMSYIQVVFYYKPTRSLQTLTEASYVQPFHDISRSLEKITVGLRAVELVEAFMQEEEPNPFVFNLLVTVLGRLNAASERVENILLFCQIRLAEALGFAPAVDREQVESLPEEGGMLDLERGAVLPPSSQPKAGRRASRSALRAYAILARAELDVVMRMQLSTALQRATAGLVEDYLRYQFESAYPTRGKEVIGQLRSTSPLLPPKISSREFP